MMSNLKVFSILSTIFVFIFVVVTANEDSFVTIKWGKIRGQVSELESKKVAQFIGIPYAEPPVGQYRFRKPRPLEGKFKGDGVFDATKPRTYCVESSFPVPDTDPDQLADNKPESEDCLTLDVWSPVESLSASESDLRPVLVFIPGGGFLIDDSRKRDQRGDIMAARGDIVVVIVRYRLGVFGCLFGDRDDMPGNLPLEDQSLALEWVRDNIQYFGGDSEKVTISGLSAGSISVSLHYMKPGARSLFHQAILQSGAIKTDVEESIDDAMKRMRYVAKKVGCGDKSLEKTINCLREVDLRKLAKAYHESGFNMENKLNMPVCLVNKGIYSQTGADRRLINGDIPKNIATLVTVMQDEGTVMSAIFAFDKTKSYLDNIRYLAPVWSPSIRDEQIEDLIRLYFGGIVKDLTDVKQITHQTSKAILMMLSDRYFRCPSIWFAEKVMNSSSVHTAEYVEISDHVSSLPPPLVYRTDYGTRHGADSLYIFGDPIREKTKFPEVDVKMAEKVQDIWLEFVKTGKLQWAPYMKLSNGEVIPFQYQIRLKENSPETAIDPRYHHCQVWKKIHYGDKF
ncbi:acetylcholinesterase-1-like [Brevipalpus obovatus]|uniref:acetylcholinesterase-1-like n=1 Tax=Brevipalpus obovatus TaxID=246614 RepID=UPI003D9E6799